MTFERLVLVALLALGLGPLAPSLVGAQTNRRALYVSVLDASGAPVPGVTPADLIVREDNVSREVLSVTPAVEPLQVAILVDDSGSARDALQDIRMGLETLVAAMTGDTGMQGRNDLAIIGLAERPTILADFTSDRTRLAKGIGLVYVHRGSGAYLLDAVSDACRGFQKRGAARPVIIVITTEGVEFSTLGHERVLSALKDSGAALHVLSLGLPASDTSTEARERAMVFDQGTRDSGGRHDMLLSSMGLKSRLAQVAAELLHQFRATYAHPQSLIPPERISVSSTHPDWTVRGTLIVPPREPGKP